MEYAVLITCVAINFVLRFVPTTITSLLSSPNGVKGLEAFGLFNTWMIPCTASVVVIFGCLDSAASYQSKHFFPAEQGAQARATNNSEPALVPASLWK